MCSINCIRWHATNQKNKSQINYVKKACLKVILISFTSHRTPHFPHFTNFVSRQDVFFANIDYALQQFFYILRALLSSFFTLHPFSFLSRAKFVPDFQPTDEVQSQPVTKTTITTTTPMMTPTPTTVEDANHQIQQNILSTSSLSPPSPEEAEKIILNLLPR